MQSWSNLKISLPALALNRNDIFPYISIANPKRAKINREQTASKSIKIMYDFQISMQTSSSTYLGKKLYLRRVWAYWSVHFDVLEMTSLPFLQP